MGAPNTTNIENETLELLEVLEINSNGDYHLKLVLLIKNTFCIFAEKQWTVHDVNHQIK